MEKRLSDERHFHLWATPMGHAIRLGSAIGEAQQKQPCTVRSTEDGFASFRLGAEEGFTLGSGLWGKSVEAMAIRGGKVRYSRSCTRTMISDMASGGRCKALCSHATPKQLKESVDGHLGLILAHHDWTISNPVRRNGVTLARLACLRCLTYFGANSNLGTARKPAAREYEG